MHAASSGAIAAQTLGAHICSLSPCVLGPMIGRDAGAFWHGCGTLASARTMAGRGRGSTNRRSSLPLAPHGGTSRGACAPTSTGICEAWRKSVGWPMGNAGDRAEEEANQDRRRVADLAQHRRPKWAFILTTPSRRPIDRRQTAMSSSDWRRPHHPRGGRGSRAHAAPRFRGHHRHAFPSIAVTA